jgi:hypothetical protein
VARSLNTGGLGPDGKMGRWQASPNEILVDKHLIGPELSESTVIGSKGYQYC